MAKQNQASFVCLSVYSMTRLYQCENKLIQEIDVVFDKTCLNEN